MAELKESAVSLADAVSDLESPIQKARAAAKVMEMVLHDILSSKHPTEAPEGLHALMLDMDDLEAAHYAMAEVRDAIGEVLAAWEGAYEISRPTQLARR